MRYDYDLVVIGGGAAGLVAATGAARRVTNTITADAARAARTRRARSAADR